MKKENKPRVVIDTNLLISAFIRQGKPYAVLQAWKRNDFLLVTSQPLIAEANAVLNREKIYTKYHLSKTEITSFLRELRLSSFLIQPRPISTLPLTSRDPKDNKLLSCAFTGTCDYLVSGDKDLLDLNGRPELESLQIITAAQFLTELTKSE